MAVMDKITNPEAEFERLLGGNKHRGDAEWFLKPEVGFPKAAKWNPLDLLLNDLPRGLFADLLYNSHKNAAFGALVFMFSVSCVLLWIVGEGLWTVDDATTYKFEYEKVLPDRATTNRPFTFAVRLTDTSGDSGTPPGVPGAKVTLSAYPANAFNLKIEYVYPKGTYERVSIPTRDVDCWDYLYGEASYWSFQDATLCSTPLSQTEMDTGSDGIARFEGLRITGGATGLLTFVASVQPPGGAAPMYLRSFISNDSPIYAWGMEQRLEDDDDVFKVGEALDFSFVALMAFEEEGMVEADWAEFASGFTFNVLSANVDGRLMTRREFAPLRFPAAFQYADYEITSIKYVPDSDSNFFVKDGEAVIGQATYAGTVRTKWSVGYSFYPSLFMGPGLMYMGRTLDGAFNYPVMFQPTWIEHTGAATLTMRTALPDSVYEGEVLDIIFDVVLPPGAGASGVPAVAAIIFGYEDHALPLFTRAPEEAPTARSVKVLYNGLAVAEQEAGGNWIIRLKPMFSYSGRVGEYLVMFQFEATQLAVKRASPSAADPTFWRVDVLSTVDGATTSFLSALDSLEAATGVLEVNPDGSPAPGPSFLVLDEFDEPLPGKTVRCEAADPAAFGVSCRSQESDSRGYLSLSDLRFTFAVADGGHGSRFYIDDVLVLEHQWVVKRNASRSKPSHIHVDVDIEAQADKLQYRDTVPVRVVNAYNEPLEGIRVWGRLGYRDREQTACGFAPADDPGTIGSLVSEPVVTDPNGEAAVPMSHVGGPCVVALSFMAEGMDPEGQFPSWGQGGYLMAWPQRWDLNEHSDEYTLPPTTITETPGAVNGEVVVTAQDAVLPMKLKIVQYPVRLKQLFLDTQLEAPEQGTANDASLTLSGLDAPGLYILGTFADGRWGTTSFLGTSVQSPVAAIEIVTPSEVADADLDPGVMHGSGTPFGVQPEVRLLDANGAPVAGARVTALMHSDFSGSALSNPVYVPSAMTDSGVLVSLNGLGQGGQTLDDVAAQVARITLPWAASKATALGAGGLAQGAGELLQAVSSSAFDAETLDALQQLSDFSVGPPVSDPSDANGVARFNYLGALNPSVTTAVKISYVYLHMDELTEGADAIMATESEGRVGDRAFKARSLIPPQPVAARGVAVSVPPTVVLYDEKNQVLPFLAGMVKAVPAMDLDRLSAPSNYDRSFITGVGVLIVNKLRFDPYSDLGLYKLEFTLPGTPLYTSSIDVVGHPHTLEILNRDDFSPWALDGSTLKVVVAALLADGSRVAGVPVTANVRFYNSTTKKKVCDECKTPSYSGVTGADGLVTLVVAIENAVQSEYVLEIQASRGLAQYSAAKYALGKAKSMASDLKKGVNGASRAPAILQPFLSSVVSSGSRFITNFLFDNALVANADTITVDTPPVYIISGVSSLTIDKQPTVLRQEHIPGFGYKVFFSDVTMSAFNLAGEGVQYVWLRDVEVLDQKNAPDVDDPLDWDHSQQSNADGKLDVKNLWMKLGAGTYKLIFVVDSARVESAEFEVLDVAPKKKVASVYERAGVIVALLLPWLFANVPYASGYWVFLSVALAGLLPVWMYHLLPGIFTSDVLFIKLSVYFTSVMWGIIVLFFIFQTVRECCGSIPEMAQRTYNDYRYVRWLATIIPFSNLMDVERARYAAAAAQLSLPRKLVLKYYVWRNGASFDAGDPAIPVPLAATATGTAKPSWRSQGGVTLHRDPQLYRQCDVALRHRYGAYRGAAPKVPRAEVMVRVHGASPEELTQHLALVEEDIQETAGASPQGLRVTAAEVGGAYARLIFEIDDAGESTHALAAPGFAKQVLKRTAQGVGSAVRVDCVLKFTPAAARRDNDPEWTFWDTWTVWMHFYSVPLLIEEERVTEECGEEVREHIDGVKPAVRVWIRHRLPHGMKRSNGQPFPDFWSPSHTAGGDAALVRTDPQGDWFVPLDDIPPADGGRPADVKDPVRMPFRFLVGMGICFVLIAFMAFVFFYYTEKLRLTVYKIALSLPNPHGVGIDTREDEIRLNGMIHEQLTYALNVIAATSPAFASVREWEPRIKEIDFISQWRWLYRVAHDTLDSITTATLFAAMATPILVLVSWMFLVRATPSYYKMLRRNELPEPMLREHSTCTLADLYIGLQAAGGAVNYVVLFAFIFFLGLLLFNESILPVLWVWLRGTIIATLLAGLFQWSLTLSNSYIFAPGMTVVWPRVYTKLMLLSAVVSLVGGVVGTVTRLAKSTMAQIILFPRLDVRSIPIIFTSFDAGYWSYWSMLYVDEMHNNPILRVFTGMIFTDYLVTKVNREMHPPSDAEGRSADVVPKVLVRLAVKGCRDAQLPAEACGMFGDVRLFVDRELTTPDGAPVAHVWAEEGGDFRYFRSPVPSTTGEAAMGDGCCRCGAPPVSLPEYYVANDGAAVSRLRLVVGVARADGGVGYYEHAVRVFVDAVPPEAHRCEEEHQGYVTSLPAPAPVRTFWLEPFADAAVDGVPSAYGERRQWLLLGSAGGNNAPWCILHDAALAQNLDPMVPYPIPPNAASRLAICHTCHAVRRPVEGDPRVLAPISSTFCPGTSQTEAGVHVPVGGSVYLEATLPSPESKVRAYAVRTSMGRAEQDVTSWVLAVAYTTYQQHQQAPEETRWHVHHEALEVPMPVQRRMFSNRFGVWPAAASQLDVRPQVAVEMKRRYPFMRQLVYTRLRHVLGFRGAQLQGADEDESLEDTAWKHKDASGAQTPKSATPLPDDPVPVTGGPKRQNGPFTSLLERSAWRNARCRPNNWALAFTLAMNPSLIETRKAFRARDVSLDQIKANTVIMRQRVDRMRWRHTELGDGGTAASPLRDAPPVPEAGPALTLSCPRAPLFNGVYIRRPEHRSRRVAIESAITEVVIQEEIDSIICARIGRADLTQAFAGMLQQRQGTGLWVALASAQHSGGSPMRANFQSLDISPFLNPQSEAHVLELYYTGVVYRRQALTPHVMRGVSTQMTAKAGALLHYVDGCWRVTVPAPAPGLAYSALVSDPTLATTNPQDSTLGWHLWDAAAWAWAYRVGLQIQQGGRSPPRAPLQPAAVPSLPPPGHPLEHPAPNPLIPAQVSQAPLQSVYAAPRVGPTQLAFQYRTPEGSPQRPPPAPQMRGALGGPPPLLPPAGQVIPAARPLSFGTHDRSPRVGGRGQSSPSPQSPQGGYYMSI
eukprot:TRINITY_DN10693_c0_g3_i2.p1 TRINITY_DN10693_c0_g3~~TRINITY_DN10693_c0_g3_i2.p1  ORF type:complete len:3177 (+),score=854.50 TRINITY_DN10693_c0_g3_i2:68-9532(+)